jgi:hypothetical protein
VDIATGLYVGVVDDAAPVVERICGDTERKEGLRQHLRDDTTMKLVATRAFLWSMCDAALEALEGTHALPREMKFLADVTEEAARYLGHPGRSTR